MDIKIKKKNKVKKFKLINKWEDVTLERWVKLINFKEKTKSSEALETIAALSDIPKDLISQLELRDVAIIMNKIAELQAEQDGSLKKIIEIEGKKYGFMPDLDSITLGEYADLEQYIKMGVEKHLPEIMAILYRLVTEETESGIYTIEAYDGNINIRAEEMKKMSAEQVQNALVFFYRLGIAFAMTLGSYSTSLLKEMKMQSPQNPLPTNGHGSE
jgi:hypothetical protein